MFEPNFTVSPFNLISLATSSSVIKLSSSMYKLRGNSKPLIFVNRAFSRNLFFAKGSDTISFDNKVGKNLSPPLSFPSGKAIKAF